MRSVRTESLDHMLIFNERYLQKALAEYVRYFNHWRPHRSQVCFRWTRDGPENVEITDHHR
jgi:hypothetical protein